MEINKIMDQIIQHEKELKKLQDDFSDYKESKKSIEKVINRQEGQGSNNDFNIFSYLEECINDNYQKIQSVNNNILTLQEDLIAYDKRSGEEINDLLSEIEEEKNFYNLNKSMDNLKIMVEKIKIKISQIEELIIIKDKINFYKSKSKNKECINENISEQEETEEQKLKEQFFPYAITNNIADFYIINRNFEFGQYTLNSKMGYSLKDFCNSYEKDIAKVLSHFNNDVPKTISYLQKTHGLCSGTKIEEQSFKNACPNLFKRKKLDFCIINNKDKIEAENLRELLFKLIENIGIDFIYKKHNDFFNSTFRIVKNEPYSSNDYKKIINFETYYVFLNGINQEVLRNFIKKINKRLGKKIYIIKSK